MARNYWLPKILEIFGQEKFTAEQLTEKLSLKKNTLSSPLSYMVKEGYLKHYPDMFQYSVTAKGVKRVRELTGEPAEEPKVPKKPAKKKKATKKRATAAEEMLESTKEAWGNVFYMLAGKVALEDPEFREYFATNHLPRIVEAVMRQHLAQP